MKGLRQSGLACVFLALLLSGCGGGGGGGSESDEALTAGTPTTGFYCTFQTAPDDCGFLEQGRVQRASIVSVGRDGSTGVRLNTQPGDNNVSGSGAMERNDLKLSQARTDGYEGREHWWAHSILLPDDFAMPTWQMYVLFDFHNTADAGGQANFHVNFENGALVFRGFGGTLNNGRYGAPIGIPEKNTWYDFVYHVKWSAGSDGFLRAWVNGVKKLDHRGPTLYRGEGVYLKLANYHVPVCNTPGCTGPASSVIHDRIIRGKKPQDVSRGPLQGALELVNGVLTPVEEL
jgi:hypothetical protein